MTTRLTIVAAMLALGLMTSCAPQQVAGPPAPPPPAPIPETPPLPPVTSEPLMWQPGHWDWTGGGYEWAKGQYVPAAGHGNLWTPGWWSRSADGSSWTWVPPHWTS